MRLPFGLKFQIIQEKFLVLQNENSFGDFEISDDFAKSAYMEVYIEHWNTLSKRTQKWTYWKRSCIFLALCILELNWASRNYSISNDSFIESQLILSSFLMCQKVHKFVAYFFSRCFSAQILKILILIKSNFVMWWFFLWQSTKLIWLVFTL